LLLSALSATGRRQAGMMAPTKVMNLRVKAKAFRPARWKLIVFGKKQPTDIYKSQDYLTAKKQS